MCSCIYVLNHWVSCVCKGCNLAYIRHLIFILKDKILFSNLYHEEEIIIQMSTQPLYINIKPQGWVHLLMQQHACPVLVVTSGYDL